MFSDFKNMGKSWRTAWANPAFRNQFVLTILIFIGVMLYNFYCLRIWQVRLGTQLNDRFLDMLPPHDFSAPIFIIQYSTLLLVFLFVLTRPLKLVLGFQMFAVVTLARTISIYFVPLEPPHGMVLLNDPVATFVFHEGTIYVTKDLFFSGHVSACVLLWLIVDRRFLKIYLGITTLLVSTFILWQHVHYTTDVLFAPLFAWLSYKVVLYFHTQTKYGLTPSGRPASWVAGLDRGH